MRRLVRNESNVEQFAAAGKRFVAPGAVFADAPVPREARRAVESRGRLL